MKVLFVATVQSHIAQFHTGAIDLLKEGGYEIHVAARNNLFEKNGLQLQGVDKVFDIPFNRSPFSYKNMGAYRLLKGIIDNEYYDMIHCNTPVGGITTRLAARKTRKKGTIVIYTAHGFHFYKGAPKKNWLIYYSVEKLLAHFTDKLVTITQEDYDLASQKFCCNVYHVHGVGVKTKKYSSVTEKEAQAFRKEMGLQNNFVIL
ncbi:MAG TPA: glycosyltransferase family 1 protein, partial [Terrisporobacter glycolicus]